MFKKSFSAIKKNLGFSLLLVILQAVFIISISGVFAYYAIQIGNSAALINEALQQSQGEGMTALTVLPDISEETILLDKGIFLFFLFSFLLYAFINGLNWNIARILSGHGKRFWNYQFLFVSLFVIFGFPAIILINIISKPLLAFDTAKFFTVCFFTIISITSYFMYTSFALARDYEFKDTFKLIKKSFILGFNKWKILIPAYLVMLIFAGIPLGLIYLFLESYFLLLILAIILFIFGLSFGKVYFIHAVHEAK